MSAKTKCPATMCPLIAPNGSPWTGVKNGNCLKTECGFFHDGHCHGEQSALFQVEDFIKNGSTAQLIKPKNGIKGRKPLVFACPKEKECQWQAEQKEGSLCPPRRALAAGIDPRVCWY